jgi:hypothetical protein
MVKHLLNLDAARPKYKVAVVEHNRHWRRPEGCSGTSYAPDRSLSQPKIKLGLTLCIANSGGRQR